MEYAIPTGARRLVTPAVALYSPEFLGLPPPQKPDQAASLLIARRRFPLALVKICGRNMVRVEDIDSYISSLRDSTPAAPEPAPAPKRGRPSKAELAAREAVLQGGEVDHE